MWTDKDNNGNAVDNKEFLTAYWRDSVKTNGSYENIYTLGMRGVHDGSFSTNMDKTTESPMKMIPKIFKGVLWLNIYIRSTPRDDANNKTFNHLCKLLIIFV